MNKKLLIGVIAVALLLRLGALTYGIPQTLVADELVSPLAAFKLLESGTLWGSALLYIPPLYALILTPIFAVAGAVGVVLGYFHGISGFRDVVIFHYEYFLIGARLLSVLFGMATLWLVWLLGRRLFSERVALCALAFGAFSFMHVHESQVGRFWVAATFFIVAGMYCLIRMRETGEKKWQFLTAAAIGFGYGAAYVPIILLPWFIAAYFLREDGGFVERAKKMLTNGSFWKMSGVLAGLIVFFTLANPYSFLRQFGGLMGGLARALGVSADYFKSITARPIRTRSGFGNTGSAIMSMWSESPLILAGGIAGLLRWARFFGENMFSWSLLLGVPVLYVFGMSFGLHQVEWRMVLPIFPILWLGVAFAFWHIWDAWPQKFMRTLVVFAFVFGFIAYSVYPTLRYTYLLQKSDTRLEALIWVEKNIPKDSVVILDDYTVSIPVNGKGAQELLRANPERMDTRRKEIARKAKSDPACCSGYEVYDISRLGGKDAEWSGMRDGFIVYSYWDESQKREKEARFAALPKSLLAAFYPSPVFHNTRDLVNVPQDPEEVLGGISRPGPYVEIYKIVK